MEKKEKTAQELADIILEEMAGGVHITVHPHPIYGWHPLRDHRTLRPYNLRRKKNRRAIAHQIQIEKMRAGTAISLAASSRTKLISPNLALALRRW
jgi:hypothetical protein